MTWRIHPSRTALHHARAHGFSEQTMPPAEVCRLRYPSTRRVLVFRSSDLKLLDKRRLPGPFARKIEFVTGSNAEAQMAEFASDRSIAGTYLFFCDLHHTLSAYYFLHIIK